MFLDTANVFVNQPNRAILETEKVWVIYLDSESTMIPNNVPFTSPQ